MAMSDPFIGEIRMVGFDFPPHNWSACDGEVLPVSQNPALASLLGNNYGGNGTTTFGLPDMRGRIPIHRGYLYNNSYVQGMKGGAENVTLMLDTLPAHTHDFMGTLENADKSTPGTDSDRTLATEADNLLYAIPNNVVTMNVKTVTTVGGGKSHTNIQPLQVVNFVISLDGIYPPRS